MPKIAKKSRKTQIQFSANITSKFDLLAMEPDMGFYYLNFHSRCQKAHIYWCYAGDAGGLMRFNQTGIAQKNPPHFNLVLPPAVDALALRDLVARLDTDDVLQWVFQLEKDIENLPIVENVIDFRGRSEEEMHEFLEYEEVDFPFDGSECEIRGLARVLGERAITESYSYCWRLPWALLDLQKAVLGIDREKEKRDAETMAAMFGGYRELKLEDVIFHRNVAVNM